MALPLQSDPEAFERQPGTAFDSLRCHWPEYLMEGAGLAIYMFFACAFATLLQHPASPVRRIVLGNLPRRALMGLAMGATVIATVLSPWGKQSGGHFNPAITVSFYRLGKVQLWDTLFYATAQFSGAIIGVAIARGVLRGVPGNEAVRYAVTAPGAYGRLVGFIAELAISFILMSTILSVSNHEVLARYTPYFVGALYTLFITFETPLSGMSMNPARTFGSAFHAGYWHALWIYFIAPTLGMLAAAEVFLHTGGGVAPWCAKLHHANNKRCIFHHGYQTVRGGMKMNNRKVAIFVLVIMLFFEWHEFRPERVDVSQRVHELTTRFCVVTPGSFASLPRNNDRHARISLPSGVTE